MIQATPFDLKLLTAAADEPIQNQAVHYEQVFTQFVERRDWFRDTNHRLSRNPELAAHGLRIPLTGQLFSQLSTTPPWSQARRGSFLYDLKVQVLALLGNHQRELGSTMYLDNIEIEHIFSLVDAPNFFPHSLAPELCHAWVDVTAACGFECGIAEPQVAPFPIYAAWIVFDRQESNNRELRIARTPILDPDSQPQECRVPLFTQSDEWAWEFTVREFLWQDRRLPFFGGPGNAPDVPLFGYCPSGGWHPGEGLRQVNVQGQRGYQDALRGLWQWEGGRARIVSPLDGHWNVQLPSAEAERNWTRWLETAYRQPVRLRGNYLNIEVNGRIVDYTFDLI